ncbi:MAG: hypothetical protein U1F53_07020 [Burkholderiaceae bacterium]
MNSLDAANAAPADDDTPTDPAELAKAKLVRDSFTIPKAEYAALNELKQRATRLTQPAKKSEILRAGIALLKSLSDKAFLDALAAVPNLKTGRPKKDGEADDESAAKVGKRVRDKTVPRLAAGGAKAADKASKPAKADKPAKPAKADKAAKPAKSVTKTGKPVDPAKKAARVAAKAQTKS